MPLTVTYGDLESGACKNYWKRGRLTWTQAKRLRKGDWLLVLYSGGYTEKAWILGKFHSRTKHYGADAVRVHLYPEDIHVENVLAFYMHSLKLPDEEDLKDVHRWGRPLEAGRRNKILKRRELKPEKQISLL